MVRVVGFQWDEGNKQKCQKHGVTLEQVEELFQSKSLFIAPDVKHSSVEKRFLAVGQLKNGRMLFCAYAYRNGSIRPISARFMHRKEREKYEEAFAKNKNG